MLLAFYNISNNKKLLHFVDKNCEMHQIKVAIADITLCNMLSYVSIGCYGTW